MLLTILTILLPFGALLAGWQFDGKSSDNPGGASLAPGLALDLQGGTQVILKAVTSDGSEITPEAMEEAIGVIRQRVDANGVTEAEIAAQGTKQIVVEIPGKVDEATVALISQAAQMKFRPVLTIGSPVPTVQPSASPSASGDGADAAAGDDAAAEPTKAEPTKKEIAEQEKAIKSATDPSDLAQITPSVQAAFDALDCTDPKNREGGGGDNPDLLLVTCDATGAAKYILGPVEVDGTSITSASSGLRTGSNGAVTNEWAVQLELNNEGTEAFRETTSRLNTLQSPRNQFAITLDGMVISAPSLSPGVVITDGRPEISGSFTRDTAATLANQLSFGSLPLTFEVEGHNTISATLGSEQLQRGLFAGLIGLALVVVYSLFQYRSLGMLTVMSLVVAGAMTYVVIALLSWGMGYRLSLPGIAGLIVAIGFTADSFIVYFERIRDELRDGRSLRLAVQRGWLRARRTIYAAKAVNLLSAVILYFMTVGGVRGFAFTLGLTTIIDVMVVIWFTHPVMELLSKVPFFRDGHKASGLSADRLDVAPRYRGAGQFSGPQSAVADAPVADAPDRERELVSAQSVSKAPRVAEDGRRMTIAERRAAERKAAAEAAQNEEKH